MRYLGTITAFLLVLFTWGCSGNPNPSTDPGSDTSDTFTDTGSDEDTAKDDTRTDTGVSDETDTCKNRENSCGDGKDNDCDGLTDCEDPDCTGKSCGIGQGTAECVAKSCKETACADGVDNDQDGKTDCADSDCTNEICVRGSQSTCPPPEDFESEETKCDGIDNDCDTTVDEGCACNFNGSETGVCGNAVIDKSGSCAAPSDYDSTDDESAVSLCDQKDNDCDGYTDEGCPCDYNGNSTGVCGTATRDNEGTCTEPSNYDSTDDESTVNGLCDGKDNDCDGYTDEGCPCDYKGKSAGVCTSQTRDSQGTCQKPSEYNTSELTPPECNDGLDNNCDGVADGWHEVNCRSLRTTQSFKDMAIDGSGNVYVTAYDILQKFDSRGAVAWTVTISNFASRQVTTHGTSVYVTGVMNTTGDHQLRKYDTSGSYQWKKILTSTASKTTGLTTDGNGHIYLHRNNGTVTDDDVYIAKYDRTGSRKWMSSFGSPDPEWGSDIAHEGSNIYIVGERNGTSQRGFVAKYDLAGNKQWSDFFGTSQRDETGDIAVYSGNVFVIGHTEGSFPNETNSGRIDTFLRSYGSGGSHLWTRMIGTPSDDRGNGIVADGNGTLYITGSTNGNLSGSAGSVTTQEPYVGKYSTAGTQQWIQQQFSMGSSGEEVDVNPSNEVFVGGLYFVGKLK